MKSYLVKATFEIEAESEAAAEDLVINAQLYDIDNNEVMTYVEIEEVKELG